MPKTPSLFVLLSISFLLVAWAGCSGDDPAGPAIDETPPAAVADLGIQSVEGSTVTVAWTAPGDDGDEGRADAYDLRWSFAPITAGTWGAAAQVAGVPAPGEPGTAESHAFDVAGKADVHVALKTADEVPNWSGLSNVPSEELDELFVVRQLTTQGDNSEPYVHGSVVVWVRDLGLDGEEIYMYDLEDPTYIITRRTGSGGEKHSPRCLGRSYIVWSGKLTPGDTWEIHTCSGLDICQLTQYTDNDLYDHTPVILGSHHFAWVQSSGFYAEIMHHQMGYADSPLSADCCPLYDYSCSELDGDGDWVIWRSVDASVTEHRIHMMNVFTGATYGLPAEINPNTAVDYSIDDGELAFEGPVGADIWVKYWDGDTVHEIEEGQSPSLSDGRVAYEVWRGDWDVHYWDGATIHEVAVAQTHDAQPSLDGDWLVWVGQPDGGDRHIFYMRVRDSKRGD